MARYRGQMTPREAPAYDRYDAERGRLICLILMSGRLGGPEGTGTCFEINTDSHASLHV